jgi:hypothetical protein
MILQLFYYSDAKNLICLHIINLDSKFSSFNNSSGHLYTMLNTARNLNIIGHMGPSALTRLCDISTSVLID